MVEQKAGRRVSVVLPARDEAATVGGIVAVVREDLVDAHRLVDEMVVVDSRSHRRHRRGRRGGRRQRGRRRTR